MKDINEQKSYYECLNQINDDELFAWLWNVCGKNS